MQKPVSVSTGRRVMTLLMVALAVLLAGNGALGDSVIDKQAIAERIERAAPGVKVTHIGPSPIEGLYEVRTQGQEMAYVSADGKHLVLGDLFRVRSDGIVNLSEATRTQLRSEQLAGVPKKSLIRFAPEGEVKGRLLVFTDIDCPYCRKLHQEVPKLNAMGIEVDYLAYPRSGPGTPSFAKAVSAWCADNPPAAMTAAKSGESIPSRQCENPVKEQFLLGNKLGVSGTPAIFLEDGRLVPGYRPAEQLAQILGISPGGS